MRVATIIRFRRTFVHTLATGMLLGAGCGEDGSSQADVDAGLLDGDGARADGSLTPLDAEPDARLNDAATAPDAQTVCTSSAGADSDKDGFPAGASDCNDCDPNVNVGAFDAPGNDIDEDCSGKADDEPSACDQNLAASAQEPLDAVKALGLCRTQQGASWGVVSARWVFPDGSTMSKRGLGCETTQPPHPLSRALLTSFGSNNRVREGQTMLALSSGVARAGNYALSDADSPANGRSPEGATMCRLSAAPPGFPAPSTVCPPFPNPRQGAFDGIALEVTIKTPSNAHGFHFDFNFFSTEWPQYVCNDTNDHFVALLTSKHASVPNSKNISVDSKGNVISVNTGLVEVCTPVTLPGKTYACPRGPGELAGTGFLGQGVVEGQDVTSGAATGWLTTSAAVVPGETITLRLAIWDGGDSILDSTVLVDKLGWLAREGTTAVVVPETVRPLL